MLKQLIDALLTDENGISEEAYNALLDYLENIGTSELTDYVKKADATDGRFYFASDDAS